LKYGSSEGKKDLRFGYKSKVLFVTIELEEKKS